jgi:HEAT repeat protein
MKFTKQPCRAAVPALLLVASLAAVAPVGAQTRSEATKTNASPPEPVYYGEPLSYWLTNFVRLGAQYPSEIIGSSNAFPFLAEAMQRGDWVVRNNALLLLPRDRRAIPILVRALREDESETVRQAAAYNLSLATKEDGAAIAALIDALKDKSVGVRRAATNVLWLRAPEAAAKAGVTGPSTVWK